MTSQIIHKELSYEVRGVLLDVYNQIGPMLPEKFYQQAIVIGLEKKGIHCETEKPFSVTYQDALVGQYYVDGWVEDGKILLELKVAPEITALHRAQALSYLKVTQADLAIIVNYGTSSLIDERLPNYLPGKNPTFTLPEPTKLEVPYPASSSITQALYRVHFALGPGFLHQVYRRATMVDLRQHSIPFAYLQEMPVYFQGVHLGNHASRLILVGQKILLATIAVQGIDDALKTNLRAKLHRLKLPIALLANFGRQELELALVRP